MSANSRSLCLTQSLLSSYLAEHLSGKALKGIYDDHTRSVSLNSDRHITGSTHCVSAPPSPPPHQCLINSGNWEPRQELESSHLSNMQIMFHELQNRIQVLCDQFKGIHKAGHLTVTLCVAVRSLLSVISPCLYIQGGTT